MPRTKTAKKESRKSSGRRIKNNARKDNLKKIVKNYERALIKGGSADLKIVYKTIDKATKVGILKPNKARRLKSKLAKNVKKGGK